MSQRPAYRWEKNLPSGGPPGEMYDRLDVDSLVDQYNEWQKEGYPAHRGEYIKASLLCGLATLPEKYHAKLQGMLDYVVEVLG